MKGHTLHQGLLSSRMSPLRVLSVLLLALLAACDYPGTSGAWYVPTYTAPSPTVFVIAPSVSTSTEARRIVRSEGFRETYNVRDASAVLVVVRSGLWYPMSSSYRTFQDLNRAAEMQLNIVGPNVHVYLYRFNQDLSLTELDHINYPYVDSYW